MKKVMLVSLVVTVLGIAGSKMAYAGEVTEDFAFQSVKLQQIVEDIKPQNIAVVPTLIPTRSFAVNSGFIIAGTINGSTQRCEISGQLLVCDPTANRGGIATQDELLLVRNIYLDQIFSTWLRTNDIREACPQKPRRVCTGGYYYVCTHVIFPEEHQVSRPCTADDISAGDCPGNGMLWETQTINTCHVSCEATSDTCTMPGH